MCCSAQNNSRNGLDRLDSSNDEAGVAASNRDDVDRGLIGANDGFGGWGRHDDDAVDAVENANDGWGRHGDARDSALADNAIGHDQVEENPSEKDNSQVCDSGEDASEDAAADSSDSDLFSDDGHGQIEENPSEMNYLSSWQWGRNW